MKRLSTCPMSYYGGIAHIAGKLIDIISNDI